MSELRASLIAWGVDVAEPQDPYFRAGWTNTRCPLCNSHKKHLGISDDGGANCWKCGKVSVYEAVTLLAPRVSRSDVQRVLRSTRLQTKTTPQVRHSGKYKAPQTTELTQEAKRYLASRGYDPGTLASTWGLRSMRSRVFVPIIVDRKPVSWTSRATKPGDRMRWLTARDSESAFPVKSLIYGSDYVHHTGIIVEGPTDAWAIGPGAVAVLGIAYTPEQIDRLANIPRKVICFDSSIQAQRRADTLATELAAFGTDPILIQLETGDDPAEADPDEIRELRQHFLGE